METDCTLKSSIHPLDADNEPDLNDKPKKAEIRIIAYSAALLGFLLASIAFFERPIIVDDGVMYLDAAGHLLAGDLRGAYHIYSRLFYPALIAATSSMASLPLEESAWLVNSLFNALLAYCFVSITGMLGANRQTLLFSAFLILTLPEIVGWRADVIRDPGFWAFHMLSVLLFLRFMKAGQIPHAIGWGATAVIATLFRSQGVVIMVLLPFVLLWVSPGPIRQRVRLLIKAHTVTLVTFAAIGVWALFGPAIDLSDYTLGGHPLLEPLQRVESFLNSVPEAMADRVSLVSRAIPRDYATLTLTAALALILMKKFAGIMTPFYWPLYLIGPLRCAFRAPRAFIHVMVWLFAINLCILLVYLIPNFDLSTRWMIPATLILLLPVPFFLSAALDRWKSRNSLSRWERLLYPILALGLLYIVLDGFISTSPSKTYLRDTGHWIKENLPEGGKLFSNNRRIDYYAGYPVDWGWAASPIATPEFRQQVRDAHADMYAVQAKDENSRKLALELLRSESLKPLREFTNGDDWVIIYGRADDQTAAPSRPGILE
ncbi:MAG TPA: hypothetical protein ENI99_07465 [Sedimenticola sp.]|nr:hypothetical protein [Sedimenticola sp.]